MGNPKGKSIWSTSRQLRHQWTLRYKGKEKLFSRFDPSEYSALRLDALGWPSWILSAFQKKKDSKIKGQWLRDSGDLCLGNRLDGNCKHGKI